MKALIAPLNHVTNTKAPGYKGTWTVSDNCSSSGTASYIVTVTSGGSILEVNIANFWDAFINPVKATINGNTISIANQSPDNDGFFVSGTGTLSGSTITWSYTIDGTAAGSGTDVCTATWTK
jgi:hypothetical protein